jgi:tetratricopeptide (TPR) repeat protein
LERPYEAEKDLKQALALDSKLLWAHHYLARCFYETGRYDDAIKEITLAIAQDQPLEDKCYHLRVRASYYMRINKLKEALADANEALKLNEDSYGNHRTRADIYMMMKKYQLAAAEYTKAIQFSRKNDADKLYEFRARAYDGMGRKDLAAKDRKTSGKALNQDPMYLLLHP